MSSQIDPLVRLRRVLGRTVERTVAYRIALEREGWRTHAMNATLVLVALAVGYVAAWAVTGTPPDVMEILFAVPEPTADPTALFGEFASAAVWVVATVLAVVGLALFAATFSHLRQEIRGGE